MDNRVTEEINGGVCGGSAMANAPEHAFDALTEQQSGFARRLIYPVTPLSIEHCEAYQKCP
jgi:hypothetical protein